MLPYTHSTNLYDKMLTKCSRQSNDAVISCLAIVSDTGDVGLLTTIKMQ